MPNLKFVNEKKPDRIELFVVHPTGIEPALPLRNMDLNHTRLPVPPRVHIKFFTLYIFTRQRANRGGAYRLTHNLAGYRP